MANYQLPNDVIRTIPIVSKDAAGDVVPAPAGVVYTAVSSDEASIHAEIQGANLVINAMARFATGVTVTVDDNGPLAAFVETMDVVDNVTPVSVGLDELNVTDVSQPVPVGPAPPP